MANKTRRSPCRAARQREQARRATLLTALGVAAAATVLGLLLWLEPWLTRVIIGLEHPTPHRGLYHAIVLDNSASNDMLRPRRQPAQEALEISATIRSLCGTVSTTVWRFASRPVEVYSGANQPDTLKAVIKQHYLDVSPDPKRGTFLAKALRAIFDQVPTDKVLVITVGTDLWEDTAEVRTLLQEEQSRRDFLLIVHGVPIHNPRNAPAQFDLRGEIRRHLSQFSDRVLILSKHDFPVHKAWLAKQVEQRRLLQRAP